MCIDLQNFASRGGIIKPPDRTPWGGIQYRTDKNVIFHYELIRLGGISTSWTQK